MNNIEKIIHIQNIRDIQNFQEISEFIQITYLTESSNIFFGNFEETTCLNEHDICVVTNQVFDVNYTISNSGTPTFRMQIEQNPPCYFSLSFHKNPQNRKFSVIQCTNSKLILVMFWKKND